MSIWSSTVPFSGPNGLRESLFASYSANAASHVLNPEPSRSIELMHCGDLIPMYRFQFESVNDRSWAMVAWFPQSFLASDMAFESDIAAWTVSMRHIHRNPTNINRFMLLVPFYIPIRFSATTVDDQLSGC